MDKSKKRDSAVKTFAEIILDAVYDAAYNTAIEALNKKPKEKKNNGITCTTLPGEPPTIRSEDDSVPVIPGANRNIIVVQPVRKTTNLKTDASLRKAVSKVLRWAYQKRVRDNRLAKLLGVSVGTMSRLRKAIQKNKGLNMSPAVANKFVNMYYQLKN